ncbi:MAG: hypothetical protein JWM48_2390 [Mycobacterium sp.]|nr:hypothetical protein [Mycobacterium sp.]
MSAVDLPAETLAEGLTGWLPEQRFFAGKGRTITAITPQNVVPLADLEGGGTLYDTIVDVTFSEGEPHAYQVPVVATWDPLPDADHARIETVGGLRLYDAPWVAGATGVLLTLLGESAQRGPVQFVREPAASWTPHTGFPLGVEQSNTSIRYGDELLLKLFRRVAPGTNPDLEVTRALAHAGSPHVAAPLAWIDGAVAGAPASLGILQPFLRTGTEGWKMATASVRDLFGEADLRADEVGGDFAAESYRLGQATAEVHRLLAQVLPSTTVGQDDCRATAELMRRRLDDAIEVVEELRPLAPALYAAYDRVAALRGEIPVQRIHGDYHLGQVLRTDSGWVLLDFEGEPARPLAERTALMSPLRDVAGMLRSFDYAARSLLAEREASAAGDPPAAVYRAAEWAERNRSAFCDGYAATAGADPRDSDVQLTAFELDKAVYEVVYEARHRPHWLPIPMEAVRRLAGG